MFNGHTPKFEWKFREILGRRFDQYASTNKPHVLIHEDVILVL